MNSVAPPLVIVSIAPRWARLLSRLQQLEKSSAVVVIDMQSLTLSVLGKPEQLARAGEYVLEYKQSAT